MGEVGGVEHIMLNCDWWRDGSIVVVGQSFIAVSVFTPDSLV